MSQKWLRPNYIRWRQSINNQPSTLYTISRPQVVTAYVHQAVSPFYANPLIAPLRVNLVSSNTTAFTLDSAGITIAAAHPRQARDLIDLLTGAGQHEQRKRAGFISGRGQAST